jgi:exonuclease III
MYCSCNVDKLDGLHGSLTKKFTHRHTECCKKKPGCDCRFCFPRPPMRRTRVLEPFTQEEFNKQERKKIEMNWHTIHEWLVKYAKGKDLRRVDFDGMLHELHMTHEEYILAVRAGLKRPEVLLERRVFELMTQNFMTHGVPLWPHNHDLQFILDAFACLVYICDYITKDADGITKIMEDIARKCKEQGVTASTRIRELGYSFINKKQICAQECVNFVLGESRNLCSRTDIFIQTCPEAERLRVLKSRLQLEELETNSTDIAMSNILDKYKLRGIMLEKECPADFATRYDHSYSTNPDSGTLCLVSKPRNRQKNLRWIHYNVMSQREDYYREQLLLFTTWRTKEELKAGFPTFEAAYNNNAVKIKEKAQEYQKSSYEDIDAILDDLQERIAKQLRDMGWTGNGEVGPVPELVIPREGGDGQTKQGKDVNLQEFGTSLCQKHSLEPLERYHEMITQLNKSAEQRNFVDFLVEKVLYSNMGFIHFLSGGAGVGKSQVIKCTTQIVGREMDKRHGFKLQEDEPTILLLAPTGTTTFNINGNTIHSGLGIPIKRRGQYPLLPQQKLTLLRMKYMHVVLFIIDEVSFISCNMLYWIHRRLQDIAGYRGGCSELDFGGFKVLLVGDLFQLKPIFERMVFETPKPPSMFNHSDLWKKHVDLYELVNIQRQKGRYFAGILNRTREGNQTTEDEMFYDSKRKLIPPMDVPYVCNKHVIRHKHNSSYLDHLPGIEVHAFAHDTVKGDVSSEIRASLLDMLARNEQSQELKLTDTGNLAAHLRLKVGMIVELTQNLNISDGLTNGAFGRVEGFDFDADGSCCCVNVRFQDLRCGRKLRTLLKLTSDVIPIRRVVKTFSFCMNSNTAPTISRSQFPIDYAFARTIHHAQGLSMDKLVVAIDGWCPDHMFYVGVSRGTTDDFLYIPFFHPNQIKVCPKVKMEMHRLRTTRFIELPPFFSNIASMDVPLHCKIGSVNVRSMNLHAEHLLLHPCLQWLDCLFLAETRVSEGKLLQLVNELSADWHVHAVNHSNNHHGTCILVRKNVIVKKVVKKTYAHKSNKNVYGTQVSGIHLNVNDVECVVIGVYRPPKHNISVNDLIRNIMLTITSLNCPRLIPCIVCGDFNLYSVHGIQNNIVDAFKAYGFASVHGNSFTTQYNTIIDYMFTNLDVHSLPKRLKFLEWTDHKMLCVAVPNQIAPVHKRTHTI